MPEILFVLLFYNALALKSQSLSQEENSGVKEILSTIPVESTNFIYDDLLHTFMISARTKHHNYEIKSSEQVSNQNIKDISTHYHTVNKRGTDMKKIDTRDEQKSTTTVNIPTETESKQLIRKLQDNTYARHNGIGMKRDVINSEQNSIDAGQDQIGIEQGHISADVGTAKKKIGNQHHNIEKVRDSIEKEQDSIETVINYIGTSTGQDSIGTKYNRIGRELNNTDRADIDFNNIGTENDNNYTVESDKNARQDNTITRHTDIDVKINPMNDVDINNVDAEKDKMNISKDSTSILPKSIDIGEDDISVTKNKKNVTDPMITPTKIPSYLVIKKNCYTVSVFNIFVANSSGKILIREHESDMERFDGVNSMCVDAVAVGDENDALCSTYSICQEYSVRAEIELQLCPLREYNISVNLQCSNTTGDNTTDAYESNHEVSDVPLIRVEDYTNSSVALVLSPPKMAMNDSILQYTLRWNASSELFVEVNTTENLYLVRHLKPYTIYNFTVCAWTSQNRGPWSIATLQRTDVGTPSVPVNFTVVSVDPFSLLLKWGKPIMPGGPLDGYKIQYKISSEISKWNEYSINKSSLNALLQNLIPYTEYIVKIVCFNIDQEGKLLMSGFEKFIAMTSEYIPDAPENLTVFDITNTTISLSWNPPKKPNGNIIDYIAIFNDSYSIVSKITKGTELTVSNLMPFTFYNMSITASTKAGAGYPAYILARTDVGVPSEPLELQVKVNSTYANLTWSPPKNPHGPLNGYAVSYHEVSVSESTIQLIIRNKTYQNVENLIPFTKYRFLVKAFNIDKYEREVFSLPIELKARTHAAVPLPPVDVNAFVKGQRSVLIEWSYSGNFPGPMNYSVQVWKHLNSCMEAQFLLLFNYSEGLYFWKANSTFLENLEPYTTYYFRVEAKTVSGRSISNFSTPVTTEPDLPGPPESLQTDCSKSSTFISISWKSPKTPNGIVSEYCVTCMKGNKYISHKHIVMTKFMPSCWNEEISTTISGLKPEQRYNFSVKAKNIGVNGYGPEAFIFHECVLPAGIPPFPENTSLWKAEALKNEVVVSWPKTMFSSEMGSIMYYTIIVAQPEKIGEPKQGLLPLTVKIPLWSHFWYNNSDIYQATPNYWNPLKNTYDPLNCKITLEVEGDTLHCTIGLEKNCSNENDVYCNGPLKPDTQYGIKMRAFTKAGFSETYPLFVLTKPYDENLSIGLILGLTFITITTFSIMAACFIWKKRIFHLPFPKISVFFCKASENDKPDSVDGCNEWDSNFDAAKFGALDLSEFIDHVDVMMSDSALKFSIEYENLKKNSPNLPCTAAEAEENRQKNRWMNVLPFDHSRVKLLPMDDGPGSDYINANYIPGNCSDKEYIASQGPVPITVNDFWRMIWEQKVVMIVMLAQCTERGKKKCEQYWPSKVGEDKFYGDLKVHLESENILSSFIHRVLEIDLGSRKRFLRHMHFTRWPDFGCPESSNELINFVKAVREHHPHNASTPILVHCSAGVGRTGTFIAADRLLYQVHNKHHVDVYNTVLELRRYRVKMVQTEDQYIFIHKCLKDVIIDMKANNIYAESQMNVESSFNKKN